MMFTCLDSVDKTITYEITMINTAKLINQLLKPVVRVNATGSGVIVYSKDELTLILTNAHVLSDQIDDEDKLDDTPFIDVDRYKYDSHGKMIGFYRVSAEIVGYDKSSDLAMLRLRDKELETHVVKLPSKESIANISVFDDVYIVGCALGEFPVPSKGILSALNAEYQKKQHWMTTAPIIMGNSGGGCFKLDADDAFKLIGIPTAVRGMRDSCDSDDKREEDSDDDTIKAIFPHLNYIVPAYRLVGFVEHVIEALTTM